MGGESSQIPEQKELEDTNLENGDQDPSEFDDKDYRSILVSRYCVYACTWQGKLPAHVIHTIACYIPVLYTIYKIHKKKLKHTSSRASSPSPSISSVSSIHSCQSYASHTSNDASSGLPHHAHAHIARVDRLHDWECMVYSPTNIFTCNRKHFIRSANNTLYGMGGSKGPKILGHRMSLMSNGVCASNIAIQYENGSIYTSKLRAASFNKFAALQRIDIVQIECGHQHSLFLASDGRVYAMGNNMRGQCGVGDADVSAVHMQHHAARIAIIDTFVRLNCFITAISCGYQHSCAVDGTHNSVYCWGDNTFNQCSLENVASIAWPTKYEYFDKINRNIRKAQCGDFFTCVLTLQGFFYGFGRNQTVSASKTHRDDLMGTNALWYNTTRQLFRDFSVGLNFIALITKFGGRLFTFGYRFYTFESNLRTIEITDAFTEIDLRNFNDEHEHDRYDKDRKKEKTDHEAKLHSVISGMDDIIVIFANELCE